MTPAQLQTIKDALDSERHYWRNVSSDPKELCDAEVAKIDAAKAALDALVDSVRWRKQSEEPAPTTALVPMVLCRNGWGICSVSAFALRTTDEWLPVPP